MTRTLIFMGLLAMSMLTASCFLICNFGVVVPLTQATQEKLKLVKKEANNTIKLTIDKVKHHEIDFHVSNKIVDSLKKTIKQVDTLLAAIVELDKTGTKEEILFFAERSERFTTSAQTNLRSLNDLYDISTYSQFETATFFPADSFNIPPEKTDEAQKVIEPVAQHIVRFLADHPRQKYDVVIACSSSRARAVADLLIDQIKSNQEFIPKPEGIRYNIKWMEQKEASSSSNKIGNTVSIIWNLVPASLNVGASDH